MDFLKVIRPPVVQAGDSTELVVRRAISLIGADGDGVRESDRLLDVLREPDDVFDLVNLLAKGLGVRPTRKELSSVVTMGDLKVLFDVYRNKLK